MAFKDDLKAFRNVNNLTENELANKLGVSQKNNQRP